MSGVPGSGKSYLANKLHNKAIKEGLSSVILSTDNFFMVDGEYKWTGSFIGEAHKWCQGLFYLELFKGTDQIIVDNTNLATWQIIPYIDSAINHGYDWDIVEPKTKWVNDAEECSKRNTHNVPLPTIERMLKDKQSVNTMKKEIISKLNLDK